MKGIPYSCAILRYVHDVSSGECLNIGVVLFAPLVPYLKASIQKEYSRLSATFKDFQGDYYRAVVRHIENRLNGLADEWRRELPFESLPLDVRLAVSCVLPDDDSSLQFAQSFGGLSDDLDATLESLYHRYVLNNQTVQGKQSRDHEEVWNSFKTHLDRWHVSPKLQPVNIKGASFEYEFRHAWKNDRWHPLEPLSMDAVEDHTLQDRAIRWVGRATDLQSDERLGTLHILLGSPQLDRLKVPYKKAIDLLHKMPIKHKIIEEDSAADFARYLSAQISQHNEEE